MATFRDGGVATTWCKSKAGGARPAHFSITLADVIAIVQDIVGEDDQLVVAIVGDLLQSGQLTRGGTGIRQRPSRRQGQWRSCLLGSKWRCVPEGRGVHQGAL
jgi:hypothetical protein